MKRRYLCGLILCLGIFCVCGCQTTSAALPEFSRLATATIPPGKQPGDINTETLENARASALQFPNGISSGIYASYGERFEDSFYSFHIPSGEPFVGRGWLFSSEPESHDFVVSCLVNYIQVPCNPDWDKQQHIQLGAKEDILFPIVIPDLADGVHDVQYLAMRDPYLGIDGDLQERSETRTASPCRNIYVGPSDVPPTVESISPVAKKPLPILAITFFIGQRADPVEPDGVRIWFSETTSPDEFVEFYIHFNNQDDPHDSLLAVMAFVDYEQVPLYLEGEDSEYLPLYVQRKSKTWQSVKVRVRTPSEVGVHEMLIIVRSYAHDQLEVDGQYNQASVYSSQRLRLEVQ